MSRNYEITRPKLGGKAAVALFVFILIAFVIESQLTQYVQTNLGFHQPYFLFYIVHSAFFVSFPLHMLYLVMANGHTPQALLSGLSIAITRHMSGIPAASRQTSSWISLRASVSKSLHHVSFLTAGLTVPSLLWFGAVSLAPISDVTAIWNTNALWCWGFSVLLFDLKWESRRLAAVILATVGVFAVVYGGSTSSDHNTEIKSIEARIPNTKPTSPLLGDTMTLVGSVLYGLYQVLYKKYVTLPSDPEFASEHRPYEPIRDEGDDLAHIDRIEIEDAVYPPPFGFHPDFLLSGIGLCTFAALWIPIPILHYLNIETFSFPKDMYTLLAIMGIALSGVAFNGGFMILLGVWGPVVTSVGNLLTIVLVVLTDVLIKGVDVLTTWSLIGSGVIVAAFGILAFDIFRR